MEIQLDFLLYAVFLFFVIIFSTIPLHFSVLIFGGRTSFMKTLYVMVSAALIASLISYFVPFGGILGFILLIWFYHEFFRISWLFAFLVWLLQLVFILLIGFALEYFGFSSFSVLFQFNKVLDF